MERMRFRIFQPCDALKPYIQLFAIQEMSEERTYKVLPDTVLVLGFQFRGKLAQTNPQGEILLNTAGVTGLTERFKIFKNSADTGTVLVYFREAAAMPFLKVPLHELFGASVGLDNFILKSALLLLEEQLAEAHSDVQRIQVMEQFLIAQLHPAPADPLVIAALTHIHRAGGNLKIRELAQQLHTSQSPLEKRFRQAVGTTPKKFADIVRLKHTIQRYQAGGTLTEIGYASGFYDQSHFIHAFKNFTGSSPEQFFNGKTEQNDFLQ